MLLVDVHAHMDLDGYEPYGGADKVIEECAVNGVKAIICNGVNPESNRKVLDICRRHSICKAALGLYPTHILEYAEQGKEKIIEDELRFIEDQIKQKKAVAIGEVGLEYKEMKDITQEQKDMQKKYLGKFLEISKEHDMPIILHSRGAELELIEFLEQEGMKNKKVIMHCFSGRKHHIRRIIDNGWYFSIPCTILRTEHFQNIVNDSPLQNIFTETDAPYLSPIIGKTNRPDNVLLTVKKIAEIKKMDPEEVANIIYNNYQKIFL
jgi:TatD DNase family protein